MKHLNYETVNTKVAFEVVDHEEVMVVEKSEKLYEFDTNSYVKFPDFNFHNGIIEVKVLSRLLKDAPDFSRGFIGIAFRINEDDSQFESFYLRPTNGRNCKDPIRQHRGCQYFSYPNYTFEYFRDHEITDYEAMADIDLDEWILIKAKINQNKAEFYINDNKSPVLVVHDLKHGNSSGSVGLFVDIGTQGYFKDLKVTCFDD